MHKNGQFYALKNGLKLTKIVHIAQMSTNEIRISSRW